MVAKLTDKREKIRLQSILLVGLIVASSMMVVFPLAAPKAKAQTVQHLANTDLEDGLWPYDVDGMRDGVVHWDPNADHWVMENYTVDLGFTLDIPAMDYMGNPATSHEIIFKNQSGGIDVWGGLITNSDGDPFTRTLFWGEGVVNWRGIIFKPGSEGCINDCMFRDAKRGVAFTYFPAPSVMLYPGIYMTTFTDMGNFGVQLMGPIGYRNIEFCTFTDTHNSAIGIDVDSTDNVNIKNCTFTSHGNNKSSLRIRFSDVKVEQCYFMGNEQPGREVLIGKDSDGTIIEGTMFGGGISGDYYVHVNGSSPFMDNCSFDTKNGEFSVLATDTASGESSHPTIRNPTADSSPGFWDDTFDNSTLKATGSSSITLQWYMNVLVDDLDGNPVPNAPVNITASYGSIYKQTASSPPSLPGDEGWANWSTVTELVLYNNSVTNYNPFNVSAINDSMIGFAFPKPTMDMSKEIYVTVPFNPTPNIRPIVKLLTTPIGVQSGLITIQYMLSDPDLPDDGNLSVKVYYSLDNQSYREATQGGGDDTFNLNNNTLYSFIWDSRAELSLADGYNTTVYIMIIPYDKGGNGTPRKTDNFTVDNEAPKLLSGPTVDVTNTTAIINWTVHEPANATVWYGLDGTLTTEISGSIGSTLQSVQLSGLKTGRNYTYTINSIDPLGNKFTSNTFTFETKIYIQLYKGWNMISNPPFPSTTNLVDALVSIAGQYDAVQWSNPMDSADPWKHYKVGKPNGNDFNQILPTMGFWIHMKNDAIFIPEQIVPPPVYLETIPLLKGWNFVGYPSVTTRDINTALAGVQYDMVQTYDAASGKWLSYDPGTYSTDTLTEMELGRGYWIHATSDQAWEVNYL